VARWLLYVRLPEFFASFDSLKLGGFAATQHAVRCSTLLGGHHGESGRGEISVAMLRALLPASKEQDAGDRKQPK
jgi:hypothetical protein